MKRTLLAGLFGLASLATASVAAADTCGGVYTVKSGDSLSVIADSLYKDAGKWTLIHSKNIGAIGPKPNAIRVGMKLDVTCLDGLPKGLPGGRKITAAAPAAAAPVKIQAGNASVRKKINLLTATDYAPFTHKESHNGGLMTEIVDAAMATAEPKEGYAIHWVDHWASHEEPLLSNALLDAGFPWFMPDCKNNPEEYRCQNFDTSKPLFELLVLLFASKDRPMVFEKDEDIFGKTICRPQGYGSYMLDQDERYWWRDGKVTVVAPATPKECYEMVLEGTADAVMMNEFTGRAHLAELGFTDQFQVVPQPVSIQAFHLIVHKTHPQKDYILETIDRGLNGLRESGRYQEIVEDHMTRIWAGF
ncbi:MAG: transporter substrate-binding domain-containing protein [Cognatishimia sp.]|uniref:peptidoglycan-binding protein LysM n=1 Tax=Cognatishimia sp. TaxID=2211648 RepID=UPI003B8D6415